MSRWVVGHVLLVVGLLWVGTSRALRSLFPLSWGGPNIGGGFFQLLAYAAIGAGLLIVVSAVRVLRASSETAGGSPRRSLIGRWLPVGVTVLATVFCAAMLIAPPGPGGNGIIGATGMSVDAAGSPVVVLVVCERSVDTVIFAGPNRGGTPNAQLGLLAASAPVSGTVVVSLAAPPEGWSGGPVALPLQERPSDLVIAFARGSQSQLSQVAFTAAQLNSLSASQVLLADGTTTPLEGIAAHLCVAR